MRKELKEWQSVYDLLYKLLGSDAADNYIHFDYTITRDSERWNIYTPLISHNKFDNFGVFIDFIKMVISGKHATSRILILKDKAEKLERDISRDKELLEDTREELERLGIKEEQDV